MSTSIVTVAEAATRLAVSRSLIRKLLATGQLTRVRIGRCVRVRVAELDALVAGTTRAVTRRAPPSEESTFIDE